MHPSEINDYALKDATLEGVNIARLRIRIGVKLALANGVIRFIEMYVRRSMLPFGLS